MKRKPDYSLYLVTDRALMRASTLDDAVAQAIAGGVTAVQLREKDISSLDFYREAVRLKPITAAADVPLIINDRVDIALAADTDGVHIGQSDLPARVVRRMIGPQKLLGVSVSRLEEALTAEADGADYLGVGAMFATGTKTDAERVSIEELRRIRTAVSIPIVIIGGVNGETLPLFRGTGADGAAVVSALMAAGDITEAARKLKPLALQMKEGSDAGLSRRCF